nr:hypothetical protein BHI3_09080 [Bacteriovorax sp. HI3]
MKKELSPIVLGAIAGLVMLSGNAQAGKSEMTKDEQVMCYGVNSCKGTGSCAGKIDACSGKNGCNAELKCAGHNECKGKGLIKTSKKECLDKGGKVASK